MKQLKEMWQKLNEYASDLDGVEQRVRDAQKRETPNGRETPFFTSKRFVFGRNDFSPQSSPLVLDAGRVTRVTRLSYTSFVVFEGRAGVAPNQTPSGTFARREMRVSSRGLTSQTGLFTYYDGTIPNARPNMALTSHFFDFEWGMSVGSTERQYAQRRDTAGQSGLLGPVYLSRNSLGNPENDKQLLFSEKHPLVLKTNEFLTFLVRPTVSYLALPGDSSFTALQPETFDGRFVVEINYAGYRTFGYAT